jgi:hypothetical protein
METGPKLNNLKSLFLHMKRSQKIDEEHKTEEQKAKNYFCFYSAKRIPRLIQIFQGKVLLKMTNLTLIR